MPRRAASPAVIPRRGTHRPGAVDVRLTAQPGDIDAAIAQIEAFHGDAWRPSTRKAYADGRVVQYGTLIVAVPRDTPTD
jgi:hypothetical protein